MYKKQFDGSIRANDLISRIGAEQRIGESLSPDTINLYGRKIRQIATRQNGGNLSDLTPEMVVRDILQRTQERVITRSTARVEKSAALFWMAEQAQYIIDSGSFDLSRYQSAYRDITALDTKELPSCSKKTSGNKLRAFPDEAVELIFNSALTDKSSKLISALLFIRANLHIGLRPVEWLESKLIVYKHRNALGEEIFRDGSVVTSQAIEVQNAKHSSVRGNGEKRIILLDNLSIEKIQHVAQWWKVAQSMKDDIQPNLSENEINRRFFGGMQRALRRVLLQSGWNTAMPTLYSTRHQAVANARMDGLTTTEIAALFGHSSVHTARQHYGKKYAGYSGRSCRPALESLLAVRNTPVHALPDGTWPVPQIGKSATL